MGLFDVQGGACSEPTYQLGSPEFDEITVHLSKFNTNGGTFRIRAKGNSADAMYVQNATFNGKPLDRCWLYRDEVFNGGELVLQMGQVAMEKIGLSVRCFVDLFGMTAFTPRQCIEWLQKFLVRRALKIRFTFLRKEF